MQRDFVEYEAQNGPYRTLLAHEVTEDTQGEVQTVSGVVTPPVGSFIVSTGNPQFSEVYTADQFGELGYAATRDQRDLVGEQTEELDIEESNDDDFFEPSEHTAKEVHDYLHREDVSDENKERVRDAEEAGQNRRSALN